MGLNPFHPQLWFFRFCHLNGGIAKRGRAIRFSILPKKNLTEIFSVVGGHFLKWNFSLWPVNIKSFGFFNRLAVYEFSTFHETLLEKLLVLLVSIHSLKATVSLAVPDKVCVNNRIEFFCDLDQRTRVIHKSKFIDEFSLFLMLFTMHFHSVNSTAPKQSLIIIKKKTISI